MQTISRRRELTLQQDKEETCRVLTKLVGGCESQPEGKQGPMVEPLSNPINICFEE